MFHISEVVVDVVHVFYSQCLIATVLALLVVLTFEHVMAANEVEGTATSKCDKCQASVAFQIQSPHI